MGELKRAAAARLPILAGAASVSLALAGTVGFAQSSSQTHSAVLASYTQPADLIAVEGQRRLNLVCMGQGSPVVVLQAGAGGTSAIWYKVQPVVAGKTRVCAYDRAGYGFSDPSPAPADAKNATADLERLLAGAGIRTPVVFVGHSLGGLYVEHFAAHNPQKVAGLVLVDPTGLDDFRHVRDMLSDWPEESTRLRASFIKRSDSYQRCADLARAGVLQVNSPPECPPGDVGEPALDKTLLEQWASNSTWPTFQSEMENFYPKDHPLGVDGKTTSQVRKRPMRLGSKPFELLLTQGTVPPGDRGTRLRAASLISAGKLVRASARGRVVPVSSDHYVHLQHPELVVAAINRVVDEVRLEQKQ